MIVYSIFLGSNQIADTWNISAIAETWLLCIILKNDLKPHINENEK